MRSLKKKEELYVLAEIWDLQDIREKIYFLIYNKCEKIYEKKNRDKRNRDKIIDRKDKKICKMQIINIPEIENGVLVFLGCHNKYHSLNGLNNRNLFSYSSGG